jgi:hypothetical protein
VSASVKQQFRNQTMRDCVIAVALLTLGPAPQTWDARSSMNQVCFALYWTSCPVKRRLLGSSFKRPPCRYASQLQENGIGLGRPPMPSEPGLKTLGRLERTFRPTRFRP